MKRVARRTIKADVERQIIIGLATSDRYLQQVAQLYDPSYLRNAYARLVASWCLDYFRRYGTPPGRHLQDMYHSWRRKHPEDERADIVGSMLTLCSQEFESGGTFNVDYVMDVTLAYFKERSLQALAEDITTSLVERDLVAAEEALIKFRKPERSLAEGVNPYTDTDAIYDAFDQEAQTLVRFPGALGRMINDQLVRESFVALQGPEKRGKTWYLMEIAIRAALSRCNVAFFECGDMSQRQIIRRQHIRLAGRSDRARYCGDVRVPVLDCLWNQQDTCTMKCRKCRVGVVDPDSGMLIDWEETPSNYRPCAECAHRHPDRFAGTVWYVHRRIDHPLTWREAIRNGRRFARMIKGRDFKIMAVPAQTMSVSRARLQLRIWEDSEGFVPDVVIFDYADIMLPERGDDFRHGQNSIWMAMRGLSQERHCLVATATQADADSYDCHLQSMRNFSEDKRKYGHVTSMFSLNQSPDEKERGLMRLGHLVARETDFSLKHTVTVLQCLRIGSPVLGSFDTPSETKAKEAKE
jgi:hypothetical protein